MVNQLPFMVIIFNLHVVKKNSNILKVLESEYFLITLYRVLLKDIYILLSCKFCNYYHPVNSNFSTWLCLKKKTPRSSNHSCSPEWSGQVDFSDLQPSLVQSFIGGSVFGWGFSPFNLHDNNQTFPFSYLQYGFNLTGPFLSGEN